MKTNKYIYDFQTLNEIVHGNLKTVQILLDYGADKFAEADGGITAFDMTVHKYTDSYFKIAELLK